MTTNFVGNAAAISQVPTLASIKKPTLFVGPAGVGKLTYAKLLVANEHPTTVRILQEPMVDDIRELNTWMLTRALGSYKTAIVDLTDSHESVQAALLKLVEEPPTRTRLILIGRHRDILATIKSRCQVITFMALTRSEIIQALEERGFDSSSAAAAAEYAFGSLAAALEFRQAEAAYFSTLAIIERETPAEAAELILNFRTPEQFIVAYDELSRRISPKLFSILTRNAGVRARLLLYRMVR